MKKIPILILLMFSFITLNANKVEFIVNEEDSKNVIIESDVQQLAERVYEINAMDKHSLSSSEIYALKYELNGIKSKLNTFIDGGGIYIGGGTLLIVIILLILFL